MKTLQWVWRRRERQRWKDSDSSHEARRRTRVQLNAALAAVGINLGIDLDFLHVTVRGEEEVWDGGDFAFYKASQSFSGYRSLWQCRSRMPVSERFVRVRCALEALGMQREYCRCATDAITCCLR